MIRKSIKKYAVEARKVSLNKWKIRLLTIKFVAEEFEPFLVGDSAFTVYLVEIEIGLESVTAHFHDSKEMLSSRGAKS